MIQNYICDVSSPKWKNTGWTVKERGKVMTDKEMRKLSRAELLEMLIAVLKKNEALKSKIKELNHQLEDRNITIQNAGSLAEASLQLNGVFEAAQAAAQQYLDNIRRLNSEQEAVCRQMEAEARKQAEDICAEADAYSQKVRLQADDYWKQASEKARGLLQENSSGKGEKLV